MVDDAALQEGHRKVRKLFDPFVKDCYSQIRQRDTRWKVSHHAMVKTVEENAPATELALITTGHSHMKEHLLSIF